MYIIIVGTINHPKVQTDLWTTMNIGALSTLAINVVQKML
jgi:hypothetical protein